MSRIVSVWLPNWSIDRLSRVQREVIPTLRPFALVEGGRHGPRLSSINGAARIAGMRIGLPLADARAALPSLATAPAAPRRDKAALLGLVHWLGRYGPRRNRDGSDGAWIDVTGVPHLFGGEAALLDDLVSRLARLGITARVGLADTLGAAHALARFATSSLRVSVISDPGTAGPALADLPVAALRIAPEAVRLLERLGLQRIGALERIPRAALERRFRIDAARMGKAGEAAVDVVLRRDQALGLVREPRASLIEPPAAHVRLPFMEPLVSSEGIASAFEILARDLCQSLETQRQGGRRFTLRLYRADGTVAAAGIGTGVTCREPVHLMRLFRDRLQGIDVGFGVDLMELEASHIEALGIEQAKLEARNHDGVRRAATGVLVDCLVNRLGPAAVGYLTPVASHIPEREQRLRSALAGSDCGPSGQSSMIVRHRPPRPALLFTPPEPISVVAEVPDGAPASLLWRRRTRRIVRAEGPERIAPEWWRCLGSRSSLSRTRDYYRLEDADGAQFWVFREGLYSRMDAGESEGAPRWLLQGVFL